jgi:kynurenine formamidase
MGRIESGTFHARRWVPPTYEVDEQGKVVGGYRPAGPHNWGRWGERDTRGTANLIGPDAVVAAARLVRRGRVISLALPIDEAGPRWPTRPAPKHYFTMTGSDGISGSPYSAVVPGVTYNDDNIDMPLQGSTQWDGLAHWSYQDSFYNGFWSGNLTATTGSPDVSIHEMRESFVGRGVLLDVPRHLGTEAAEPGMVIGPELLDEVAAAEDVEIHPGDMLLVRTGNLRRWYDLRSQEEKEAYFGRVPGLGRDCIGWLYAHDIAAVAADTVSVEVMPNEEPVERPMPLHHAALVDLGLTLGEFWALDALAEDCAEDGIYEFLLVAPPLNIPGAVGSPLNPIAVK